MLHCLLVLLQSFLFGLALSSRNQLILTEHRQKALAVPRSLYDASKRYKSGETNAALIVIQIREELESSGATVDYIEAVDAIDLRPKSELDEQTVIALAAFFGTVRLIDNHLLNQEFPVQIS